MYLALHLLPTAIPAGFIHLPPYEALVEEPDDSNHMPLQRQAHAIEQAIRLLIEHTAPTTEAAFVTRGVA